jgi:hypothetical protein
MKTKKRAGICSQMGKLPPISPAGAWAGLWVAVWACFPPDRQRMEVNRQRTAQAMIVASGVDITGDIKHGAKCAYRQYQENSTCPC